MSSAHAIENKKKEISLLEFLGQNTCSLYFHGQQNITHMSSFQCPLTKAHPQTTNKDDQQQSISNTGSGDRSSNISSLDEDASPG